MHPLLERQLRRIFGDSVPSEPGWDRLLSLIDDAYLAHDDDQSLLERALDLSSNELLD